MSTDLLQDWISNKSDSKWHVYIKRLSANDTGATGGHGSGIYIPSVVTELAFPAILDRAVHNPDHLFTAQVDSHDLPSQELRVIYYNSKYSEAKKNGRDEQRITRWKQGVDYAPIQDPENTGALTVLAFKESANGTNIDNLHVWVCKDIDEESLIEGLIGELAPAEMIFEPASALFGGIAQLPTVKDEDLTLPDTWMDKFPSGKEIINFVIEQFPAEQSSPDQRITFRRRKEFTIFRMVEDRYSIPLISTGFTSVEKFIEVANSISNRRKSRAGRSLELHLEEIFNEEGVTNFDTQAKTENNKRPDFLFPGIDAYNDQKFPSEKLNLLAVKTTLKDRWRQVLSEADRITPKYLFTLQEGVSQNQYKEMQDSGIRLVVPEELRVKFPSNIRSELLNLEAFINHLKRADD